MIVFIRILGDSSEFFGILADFEGFLTFFGILEEFGGFFHTVRSFSLGFFGIFQSILVISIKMLLK